MVTAVTYLIFMIFGLNYPLLLSVAVGISVRSLCRSCIVDGLVALVAVFQFGDHSTFWYIMAKYVISQLLDGKPARPLLFSEAVNLHPLTIIVAVLIFGGLWGF